MRKEISVQKKQEKEVGGKNEVVKGYGTTLGDSLRTERGGLQSRFIQPARAGGAKWFDRTPKDMTTIVGVVNLFLKIRYCIFASWLKFGKE